MRPISVNDNCSGCEACVGRCPNSAIHMKKDKDGFKYPQIDSELCNKCGRCFKVCQLNNCVNLHEPMMVKAAQSTSDYILSQSASGGICSEITYRFIRDNGAVFGCNQTIRDSRAKIEHIKLTDAKNIDRISGSKYVFSEIGKTFFEVENLLIEGYDVLFIGLPCQIAGLYSFLENEYDNLYTIDLLCHGVSNSDIYNKYLQNLSKEYKGEITDYIFRDKRYSNDYISSIKVKKNNKNKTIRFMTYERAFWYLFQYSLINRKSCYTCMFSSTKRIGDVSTGDFWGFSDVHKEVGDIRLKYNVSCVLINSSKGRELWKKVENRISSINSTIEAVERYGAALRESIVIPNDRDTILAIIREQGFEAVERYCRKKQGVGYYKHIIGDYYRLWKRNGSIKL